jgi:hypothetical protein
MTQLSYTLERLLQLDPHLQHLQTAQKMQVVTCQHLCKLTQALNAANEQIHQLQTQLQSVNQKYPAQPYYTVVPAGQTQMPPSQKGRRK